MRPRSACLAAILALVVMLTPAALAEGGFSVAAKGAALIEARTGRVLFARNANEMLPMASTTKIMTCLLALENSPLDAVVTAGPNAYGTPGTSIYLSEGESLTMEQMLYGLMLRSGNDAAVAIAEHVGGSVEGFAEMMNARAKELGADATYVNPHGLSASGHRASALALTLIMREGLKNPDFARITATKEKVIPWEGNDYSRLLQNKNKLLTTYEGAMGGKTGYTSDAGRCLVFSAQRDGMTLIGCVLNCSTWFDTATAMLDYGFENWSMTTIARQGDVAKEVSIFGGEERAAELVFADELSFPLMSGERYTVTMDIPDAFSAPVRAGDAAGCVVVEIGGREVCRVDVVFASDVAKNNMETALGRVLDGWLLVIGMLR